MNQSGEVRGAGIEGGGSIFDPALYVPTQGFMGCPNSYDLEGFGVVDCGDAKVMPGRIEPSFEVMEAALREIAGRGVRTLTMGGDGSVTLPQLRALHRIRAGAPQHRDHLHPRRRRGFDRY
jgi:hypothetical protein